MRYGVLEEQLLAANVHDRQSFTCGISELDDYLQRFAIQQSKKGLAVVRVLVDTAVPQTILGFYSLNAAQVDTSQLDEKTQKKLPRYPVPCFRLGRLATHSAHQGKGLGRLLIGCAVKRCLEARQHVAAYALLVDAKNADAQAFYAHYGFTSCKDTPKTMYLPLGC